MFSSISSPLGPGLGQVILETQGGLHSNASSSATSPEVLYLEGRCCPGISIPLLPCQGQTQAVNG